MASEPTVVSVALALQAFRSGFAMGADVSRSRRRHGVDPLTHEFWRRGYDAGRVAITEAEKALRASFGGVAPVAGGGR